MKLKFRDEPKEWRKSALLATTGLAFMSLFLRWRGFLRDKVLFPALIVLAVVAVVSLFQPRWFRGFHRFSVRLGLAISQFIGFAALILFFIFILTPIGLILRLLRKDILQLKTPPSATTYWRPGKDCSPLDRLF